MGLLKHDKEHAQLGFTQLGQRRFSAGGFFPDGTPSIASASRGSLSAITNLVTNPYNLNSGWTLSAQVEHTGSHFILPGDGNGRVVRTNTFSTTSGHQYLAVFDVKAKSFNVGGGSAATNPYYPIVSIEMLDGDGVTFLLSDDTFSGDTGYGTQKGYMQSARHNSRFIVRFTSAHTGAAAYVQMRDGADNTKPVAFEFNFAGVYDLSGATIPGIIYDATANLYLDLTNNTSFWGDSFTTHMNQIRGRLQLGRVNINGGSYDGSGKTTSQILTNFQSLSSLYNQPALIWMGHNNVPAVGNISMAQTKADFTSLIGSLTNDYRILTCCYNSGWINPRNSSVDFIDELNAWLISAYGPYVIDIRPYLLGAPSGTGQDITDVNWRLVPTSLRADAIHLSYRGQDIAADGIYENLGLRWSA